MDNPECANGSRVTLLDTDPFIQERRNAAVLVWDKLLERQTHFIQIGGIGYIQRADGLGWDELTPEESEPYKQAWTVQQDYVTYLE